ncbi:MAG TPA: FHA domain-containing protein [Myxococcaceae bacterium]|jgi:hypothetical protein|nr:FHA domain-containing protein [Myxococcaceae bacterium]
MLARAVELPRVSPFTDVMRLFVDDEAALTRAVTAPVLVWEAGLFDEHDWTDRAAQVPGPENPLVLLVRKSETQANPFPEGISLGRASVNDVVLPHKSISRFHAYLQQEPSSARWALADAASRNGTFADGVPLAPNVPALLGGASRLRVGHLDLTFLSPEAFVRWLRKVAETV